MSTNQKYRAATKREKMRTKAPLKIDRLIYGLFKAIIAILLLYIIYFLTVVQLRSLPNYSIWLEVLYVFTLMIFCDLIAMIIAGRIDAYIIHKWGYIRNSKKRKNLMFKSTDYLIYTSFRTISLITSLVWIMSAWYYAHMYAPWYNYAFLVAWFTVSVLSKFGAWCITNVIFPS